MGSEKIHQETRKSIGPAAGLNYAPRPASDVRALVTPKSFRRAAPPCYDS